MISRLCNDLKSTTIVNSPSLSISVHGLSKALRRKKMLHESENPRKVVKEAASLSQRTEHLCRKWLMTRRKNLRSHQICRRTRR